MARYTDDSRERVRDAVDFVELVGARTELRQAGPRRMTGLCPFHEERTPSFGIDPGREALPLLRLRRGRRRLQVRDGDGGARLRGRAGVARRARRRRARARGGGPARRRAPRSAASGCWRCSSARPPTTCGCSGSPRRRRRRATYLAERGLEEGALREFRVGWSPRRLGPRADGVAARGLHRGRAARPPGWSSRGREGRGLLRPLPRPDHVPAGRRARPRARLRRARARADDQQPKYLNTSEAELFHKGRIVYGADLARAAAAKAGRVVLVEGYTDVIALRQAGDPGDGRARWARR